MDLYIRLYNDSFHDKYYKNVRNLVAYNSKEKCVYMDGTSEDFIFCSFTDSKGKIIQYSNCVDIEVM